MPKVLLIDPSVEWLDQAKKVFADRLFETEVVSNGKEAQLRIYNNKYFFVVLNLDVQNHPGIQVMKFIKSNHPAQNVVLLVSSTWLEDNTLTETDLAKMGATDYLVTPVKIEDLVDLVDGKQSMGQVISAMVKNDGQGTEKEEEAADENFSNVKINDFLSCKVVLFDIFIKLNSGRYLKILHAGDSFTKERIEKYKNEKKIEFLYFKNSDRKKYIRYINYVNEKMIASEKVPPELKLSLNKNAAEKLVEDLYSEGVKPATIEEGKKICENMYNTIQKEKNLYKLLRGYQDFDPSAYTHSYLVSLFSSMIIKQFEWQSKATMETVTIAAFLHDIGKSKMAKELLLKRPEEMSPQELDQYHAHPRIGVEMLTGNRCVSRPVLQIIGQHHEYCDGTGFPDGLKDSKLLTLTKIMNVANFFSHVVQEQNITPVVALKHMLKNPSVCNKFNAIVLEKFINVFMDPDKIQKDRTIVPSNSTLVKKAS